MINKYIVTGKEGPNEVNLVTYKMKRSRPRTSVCPAWMLAIFCASLLSSQVLATDMFVYFGSHGKGPGFGFSLAHFDTDTGKLTTPVFMQEAVAPAYFIIHPDGKHLYTCNSAPGSAISAYAIDSTTAKLTFLNEKPSGGGDPSYICLDGTGRYVMVANYDGGSIAVYSLKADGSIGERTASVQQTGSSVNPQRQTHARAHSIRVDPTNRFVLVADLGTDKLMVYRFNSETGTLEPNDPPFATVAPGSGPRHTAFDPKGRCVYLINEIASNIIRFVWDSNRGRLTQFETVSALPPDFHGTSTSAELLIHPSGKFMYSTNRGEDSVAVFSVNPDTGSLTLIQNISTRGETPRNCDFDPSGRWLLVSNQDSNNAVVFAIDPNTGKLKQNGEPIRVLSPFCERFVNIQK